MDFKRITVVVTPAPNQDLISLKDARDELRAQRADDARLRRYIEESSAAIATYTAAIAAGATTEQAAHLANYAGGIVVMKRGTATVSQAELLQALEKSPPSTRSH